MKREFRPYIIVWVALLAAFNAVAFLAPSWFLVSTGKTLFWIAYGVMSAAMLGQLICAWVALRFISPKRSFYDMLFRMLKRLKRAAYTGVVATAVIGAVLMLIPVLTLNLATLFADPETIWNENLFVVSCVRNVTKAAVWVASVLVAALLLIHAAIVVKAKLIVAEVVRVDTKVEKTTAFMYDMRAKGTTLVTRAKSDDVKAICKKVQDAFAFSDPVSNPELAGVEKSIQKHFELLKNAVAADNLAAAKAETDEILALVAERNSKCKASK